MKIACWVAVGMVGGLLGCGQKGPLVLPDAQHPHKKIALPKPPTAPQSSPVPSGTAAPVPSSPVSSVPATATPSTAPTPTALDVPPAVDFAPRS